VTDDRRQPGPQTDRFGAAPAPGDHAGARSGVAGWEGNAPVAPPGASANLAAAPRVEVGPVRFGELPAVGRLQRRAFRPRLAYGLGTLVLLRLLPHVRFLVARRGETVVGCAIGDRQGPHARIINVAVDPNAQRQGVGAALLQGIEAALPSGNVLLMVEQENAAALALYRRAGYAQVGIAADYYGRGRHGLWMQKRRGDLPTPKLRF
jgi:ribosomal protein S18 acetylase RimI-like enzyme